jgi:hypothetical protein
MVEESAELVDRDTGRPREVDVVVTFSDGDKTVIVSIEAADYRRPATVQWVEQLISKHDALDTDRLVLVAGAGFSGPALLKAAARGVTTITPEDLDNDHEFAVLAKVAEPPVTVQSALAGVELEVRHPPGAIVVGAPSSVRRGDGTHPDLNEIGDAILDRHFKSLLIRVAADLKESGRRRIRIRDVPPEPLFAQCRDAVGDTFEVAVTAVELDVDIDVELHPKMDMFARLFDRTAAFYGKTSLGDAELTFVATEDTGQKKATLRTREPGNVDPTDWTLDRVFDIEPDNGNSSR